MATFLMDLVGLVARAAEPSLGAQQTAPGDGWLLSLQGAEVAIQFLSLLVIAAGAVFAILGIRISRHQALRDVHSEQISNIHDAYVTDWKEKEFARAVKVTLYSRPDGTRYAHDQGVPGNQGDIKVSDEDFVNRVDIRNLIRRHLRFNYIQAGADYEGYKRALLDFWQRSKVERSWEKTACYNLTSSLQDLGVLVRTGALPANYVFMNAGRHIIEEWVYGMELVYGDFRRPGLNVPIATMRSDPEMGAMRRHGEWLACACAIYWHNHYNDGVVNFFIAEMERACRGKEHRLCSAKTRDLYNFGDKIELRMPLDIECIIKRERALFPLDDHLMHERISSSINADINDILHPDREPWSRRGVNASRRSRWRKSELPKLIQQVRAERKMFKALHRQNKLLTSSSGLPKEKRRVIPFANMRAKSTN